MIPTFKPSILRKDMDAVLTCMVEELFGHGETSREFQKKLAKQLELHNVFGVKEYQRSFEILIKIFEIEEGGRVALSPLSPWWYHTIIKARNLIPVYLDIDQDRCTFNIDELKSIEEKADLIFIYHNLGYEQNFPILDEIEIPVIEDISEILALRLSSDEARPARAGIFSLRETGYLAGLGGAYVFIRDRKDAAALKKQTSLLDNTQLVSDMQSALGSSQLSKLEKYNNKRTELRNIFLASLLKTRNRTFAVDEDSRHIPYSFPVILNSGTKEVFQYARKKKISCANAFEESIISRFPDEVEDCPGARSLALRCVLFPLYPSLSSSDTDLLTKVLSTLP